MTSSNADLQAEWVNAAAQLMCTLHLTDYQQAKLKARDLLGLGPNAPMPDNVAIEAAILVYQQLFGGAAHTLRLRRMRETAVQAMRWLQPLDVRLVGAVISGAVTEGSRVQLHALTDDVEAVDFRFLDRGMPFEQAERRYRLTNGKTQAIPLLQFDAGDIGVDLAVFAEGGRAVPLSPVTGKAARRLRLKEVEALLA